MIFFFFKVHKTVRTTGYNAAPRTPRPVGHMTGVARQIIIDLHYLPALGQKGVSYPYVPPYPLQIGRP